MKIKLNNKKYKIPTAEKLTVSQYIELSKLEKVSIVDYLKVVTGLEFADISKIQIDEKTIYRINNFIGLIIPFQYFYSLKSVPDDFYLNGKTFDLRKFDRLHFGLRVLFEQRQQQTENPIELAVYMFASFLSNGDGSGYDADKANEIYLQLLEMNSFDIISISGFFLHKFMTGLWSGKSSLKRLLTK